MKHITNNFEKYYLMQSEWKKRKQNEQIERIQHAFLLLLQLALVFAFGTMVALVILSFYPELSV